jgi:hypothetical protein
MIKKYKNGKWIDEKNSHKLRNQLSPYWTLSSILVLLKHWMKYPIAKILGTLLLIW